MAGSVSRLTLSQNEQNTDDLPLIEAAREDPKEFGSLYNLYVERVFKYLFSRVGNVKEAEDITSQTFLAAFESFRHYRHDGHFSSWLFTIARNKAMDHFRRRKNLLFLEKADEVSQSQEPLQAIIQSEQSAALGQLIATLPEDERELLRLRFLAEMSFVEIARLLHRNGDAVKKSIYRLLARLHSQLEVSNE